MGLGQLRGPSWEIGTRLAAPIRFAIIAHGGLDVCDGEHRWFVMKKTRRRIAEVGTPAASYVSKRTTLGAVWRREAKVPLCYQTSGPPFAKSTRRMGHPLHGLCRRRAGHPRGDLALGVVAGARASRHPRLIDGNLKGVVLVGLSAGWLSNERT